MPLFEKHFTVDEANTLIPRIITVFDRIHSMRDDLEARKEELKTLHDAAPGNGGSRTSAQVVTISEAIARLIGELEAEGIMVKDIDAGLVDFPHLRDGDEVFLCWKMGEKAVAFWHEIESGYQGRQPL